MARSRSLWRDPWWSGTVAFLGLLFILGSLAPVIATDGGMIPFGPEQVSPDTKTYSPPGTTEVSDGITKTHLWGTDGIGRDVASRLMHGITVAFKVGLLSTAISLLIALILGSLAGYVGDRRQRINWAQLLMSLLGLIIIHHIGSEWSWHLTDNSWQWSVIRYLGVMCIGMVFLGLVYRLLDRIALGKMYIAWDTIVVKLIEIFKSIPRLFLLIAIFALITKPSLWSVILIIGLIQWPSLTRLIRAEILTVKQEDYIHSAKVLGLHPLRILIRHVWPNIYQPIFVLLAVNMGIAILIESSLSFLGIGLPLDQVSWGRMLSDARQYIPAWWLAVGPGILIFVMIISFNILGDRLSRHYER